MRHESKTHLIPEEKGGVDRTAVALPSPCPSCRKKSFAASIASEGITSMLSSRNRNVRHAIAASISECVGFISKQRAGISMRQRISRFSATMISLTNNKVETESKGGVVTSEQESSNLKMKKVCARDTTSVAQKCSRVSKHV